MRRLLPLVIIAVIMWLVLRKSSNAPRMVDNTTNNAIDEEKASQAKYKGGTIFPH